MRVGRGQKEAFVVETKETVGEAQCACQKVTEWARWVRLPYCRKGPTNKENSVPFDDRTVLYATVDFSRKIRRRALYGDGASESTPLGIMSKSLDTGHCKIAKPLPNYENLKFAQSLEYYENSKDVIGRFHSLRSSAEGSSCREQYVAMCPVKLPPTGYAAMAPARPPARCASQPELLAETKGPSRAHRTRCNSADSASFPECGPDTALDVTSSSETLRARGVPTMRRDPARDSSSSADSGVCVRELTRRGLGATDTSSSAEAELPVVIRGTNLLITLGTYIFIMQ